MLREVKIPAVSVSVTKLLIIFGLIFVISGLLFYILFTNWQLSNSQAATAEVWLTSIALVKATSVSEVRATASADSQAVHAAQTPVAATIQAQATAITQVRDTALAQKWSATVVAVETSTASKVQTAVAAQIRVTAIIRSRVTATALAQAVAQTRAAATAQIQATSTAQAQATTTAQIRDTAIAQAWLTTVIAAKATAADEVRATSTAQMQATATARTQGGSWLVFQIQSATVLADKGDGLDGDMEFWMYTTMTDGKTSTRLSYPNEADVVSVSTGQSIPLGQYALAVDQGSIDDELAIYITALDSDSPLDEAILRLIVEEALEQAFLGVVKKYNSVLSELLPEAVSELVDWVYLYFDRIGEDIVILKRSENWKAGQVIKHRTGDGSLEILYQVFANGHPPSLTRGERNINKNSGQK